MATMKHLIILACVCGLALGQNISLAACPEPPYNNALAKIIADGLEAFRPYMAEGAPSLGIPPLDPLGPFPGIPFNVQRDEISLEGSVNGSVIYNLSKYIVCEVNVDIGLRPSFYLELRVEDFHVQDGIYNMTGLYQENIPIFGTGEYILDVLNASMGGGARVSYNIITDHAQIHDLEIDLLFEDLQLYMECIYGCGEMSDIVNDYFLSDIAEEVFNVVWDYADPIITEALENGINNILKDIKISDVISPGTSSPLDDGRDIEPRRINFKFPLSKFINKFN